LPIKFVLGDFGSSAHSKSNSIKGHFGTRGYYVPEIIGRPTEPFSADQADAYTLGIFLFRLLFKTFPPNQDILSAARAAKNVNNLFNS